MASRITDPTALERARKALEDHAWHEAFDGFFEADRSGELAAEDLERLSEAAWWTAHPSESIDAAERAYAAYLADGNRNRAAFMAVWLAVWFEDQGDPRVANGWSQRAIRLVEGQPDSVEIGYVDLRLVKASLEGGAIEDAQTHADHAAQIAERFGDPDLQAFATCVQGAILIALGRVQEGFAKIDEATAAAVGGELSPIMGGRIYCITIGMCKSVADYRRAAEWTEAASRWCERYSITGFPGVCRIQRAEIMRLRGSLVEAEEEAPALGRSSPRTGRSCRRPRAPTRSARSASVSATSTARRRRSGRRTSSAASRSRASPSCSWPENGSRPPGRRSTWR
jgi:hypothetical protein